jgi:hypothetical protein
MSALSPRMRGQLRDTNGQEARHQVCWKMLSRRELLFEHGNACLADAEVLH